MGLWCIGMCIVMQGLCCMGCSLCECIRALGCGSLVKWERSRLCICHNDLLCPIAQMLLRVMFMHVESR